jgi:glycosyltransferase involved in cell wall biosynthesis
VSALWITRDIERFDVVLMNRDLVPETSVRFLEPWLARRNPRMVFDFDDAIFLGPRESKLQKILPHFALVTAGNPYLAEFARRYASSVEVWPTVVDTERFKPALERQPGPLRIGWSGSQSTLYYCLPLIRDAIVQLARTEEFEFLVVADREPQSLWPGVAMRFIPWSPETEVQSLQLFDIGLMPLKDDPFERGKCGAKAITYMAAGIPPVISPVGVNAEIVEDGVSGFFCTGSEEWVEVLRMLLHNSELRKNIGAAARRQVETRYSVWSLLPVMIGCFRRIDQR